ncbi:hypothetical protein ACFTWH_06080 [Streptomyces sp. NPDC057011]
MAAAAPVTTKNPARYVDIITPRTVTHPASTTPVTAHAHCRDGTL